MALARRLGARERLRRMARSAAASRALTRSRALMKRRWMSSRIGSRLGMWAELYTKGRWPATAPNWPAAWGTLRAGTATSPAP